MVNSNTTNKTHIPPEQEFDYIRRKFLGHLGKIGVGGLLVLLFSQKIREANALSFGTDGLTDPVGIKPLGGSQTTGSLTLTNADTWYLVPTSTLQERVFLVLQNRSQNEMYWSFDNGMSNTTGGLLFPAGGSLSLDADDSVNVYVRCSTAGQEIWYAESQSQ